MIRLRPEDASLLARIAQYDLIGEDHFAPDIKGARADARKVARRIFRIRAKKRVPKDESTALAKDLLQWAENNRRWARERKQRMIAEAKRLLRDAGRVEDADRIKD